MSKNLSIQSAKIAQKITKFENYFQQKFIIVYHHSYKCTISYLQLIYLMWFLPKVIHIAAVSEAMSKIFQVKVMNSKLKSTNLKIWFRQECWMVCFFCYAVVLFHIFNESAWCGSPLKAPSTGVILRQCP